MNESYLVFDTEFSIENHYERVGNPFYNEMVAFALKNKDELYSQWVYGNKIKEFHVDEQVLVGHNIKVDILFLWPLMTKLYVSGLKIWDTQLAHYILSGQKEKFPALRDIAVNQYGCKEREKIMENYWADNTTKIVSPLGYIIYSTEEKLNEQELSRLLHHYAPGTKVIVGSIDTKDIPKELVLQDVENDVLDTEQVYLRQVQEAKERGMYALIEAHNDTLLAICEMEYNGMFVDTNILKANKKELEQKLVEATNKLNEKVKEYWQWS